jgi:serine/threonine-protein kinase
MAAAPVVTFLNVLREGKLLEPEQLDELGRDLSQRFPEPRDLARELVKRGWMTAYQINQIAQGKARHLSLGPYVLLECLGEGAMGQVFKARHRKLDRIVALKIIRKERLKSAHAIQRFQREARAVAKLSHPNIVAVYDADEIGGTHFMAMEFVDGIDLARLVKQAGPLPVGKACEYVRQAAVGLQHAHEKGLVHRDIKPHNLLLARTLETGIQTGPRSGINGHATTERALVKILDMGLARLSSADNEPGAGAMTQEGTVMGTPEYLAPEQARDAHRVDIRADVYSLGCTLYFLLSGRPPYRGASLADTLLMHQLNQAPPLQNVPAEVQAIVSRMIAKKPEDRYQTPAEVAQALAPFCLEEGGADTIWSAAMPPPTDPSLATNALGHTLASASGIPLATRSPRNKKLLGAIAGGILVLLLAVAAISRPSAKQPPVEDDAKTKDQGATTTDSGTKDKNGDTPTDKPPNDKPFPAIDKLDFPYNSWIDVTPYVNPAWHAVLGDWTRTPSGEIELTAPARGKARIAVPVLLQGCYDLRLTFTKTRGKDGGVFAVLPVADHSCRFVMGGNGDVIGIEEVKDKTLENNPTTIKHEAVKLGAKIVAEIRVRTGPARRTCEITATVGRISPSKFHQGLTPTSDLEAPAAYRSPVAGLSLVGCDDGTLLIHSIEIRRSQRKEHGEIRPFDEQPKVLAVFRHSTQNFNYLTKFYSNGRLDYPLSPFTWTLENRSLVRTLGDRKQTCTLSPDGKSYEGTNTDGRPVSGELVNGSLLR